MLQFDHADSEPSALIERCGLESVALLRRNLSHGGILAASPGARALCEPIRNPSFLWRPYMARHRQNSVWQYHNGGIWPFIGGFRVAALVQARKRKRAAADLVKLARVNALGSWGFREWLHGRTRAPRGMRGQSWNAAAFMIALRAVRTGKWLWPASKNRQSARVLVARNRPLALAPR